MNNLRTAATFLIALLGLSCASGDQPPEEGMRPELAGAVRVTGSLADEDGRLPQLYLEYITVADQTSHRLAIYRNGLITLTTASGGRSTDKMLLFPPGAVDEYETYFSAESLSRISQPPLKGTPTGVRETIRIYDSDGDYEQRVLDPSLVLSGDLERQRIMLRDLVQLLHEDREISTPFNDYIPQAGDVLIDGEMGRWTILRYHSQAETLEVTDSKEIMRMYINLDQIDEMFIGFDRSGSSD